MYSYIGKSVFHDHFESITDLCFIQNHSVTITTLLLDTLSALITHNSFASMIIVLEFELYKRKKYMYLQII